MQYNKVRNIIQWFLAKALKSIVYCEHKYLYKRDLKVKRRLFSTTGNISLINALTLIRQLNEPNCEDYLIINSNGSDSFWDTNYKIAKLHNFKKIIKISNIRYETGLIFANLYKIDEIYTINHPFHLKILNQLFDDAEINLIDEGCASLISYNFENTTNFKYFYTNRYLNKIDGIGFSEEILKRFKPLSLKEFKNISKELQEKYPINLNFTCNRKNILYCGVYWYGSGLSKSRFYEEEEKMLNALLEKGYNIYFKPHPRDTNYGKWQNSPYITFINSFFPIEIYELNIVAVVAMSSASVLMYSHYHNVAAFSNVLPETINRKKSEIKFGLIRYIFKEYTLDYTKLLNENYTSLYFNDLKVELNRIYQQFLDSKMLLSKNQDIINFINGGNSL